MKARGAPGSGDLPSLWLDEAPLPSLTSGPTWPISCWLEAWLVHTGRAAHVGARHGLWLSGLVASVTGG